MFLSVLAFGYKALPPKSGFLDSRREKQTIITCPHLATFSRGSSPKPGVLSAFLPASPLISVILWPLGAESSPRVLRASARSSAAGSRGSGRSRLVVCSVYCSRSQGTGLRVQGPPFLGREGLETAQTENLRVVSCTQRSHGHLGALCGAFCPLRVQFLVFSRQDCCRCHPIFLYLPEEVSGPESSSYTKSASW